MSHRRYPPNEIEATEGAAPFGKLRIGFSTLQVLYRFRKFCGAIWQNLGNRVMTRSRVSEMRPRRPTRENTSICVKIKPLLLNLNRYEF